MSKFRKKKRFLWPLIIVVIIVLVGGTLWVLHNRSVHRAQNKSGTIPTSKKNGTKKKAASTATTNNASASQNTDAAPATSTDKSAGSVGVSATNLVAPFGSFVSNHAPGQNGSPKTEQSVCNTTPGATCDIQFKNASGVVKTLGEQATDSNGSSYWSWNVDGATLAPGSWQVTAVVKLNGQTKTATDPTPLQIQ
jgi:cytoskeletal protein RodZ